MEPASQQRLIMLENQFTIEQVRELFSYDPVEGIITRLKSYGRAIQGQVFQHAISISVLGVHIRMNRLCWALHYGEWPPEGYYVDHDNNLKGDHRLENLRLATPTENQQNKAGSGQYPKGVTWRDRKEKPWQAKIRVDGVRLHLGSFADIRDAQEAYMLAALHYHGEFACLD